MERVSSLRQPDFSILLENIHDTHNIGAVLRSADSVGIREAYVLHSDPERVRTKIKIGKRTSSGSRKWLDVHFFNDREKCMKSIQARYEKILGASVNKPGKSLYENDLSGSVILVFGNEHEGITDETLAYCTGTFFIPQMGMTESLNVSVACAISLYEGLRQREIKGFYGNHPRWTQAEKTNLMEEFVRRHEDGFRGENIFAEDE
ncbi:MAG: RNA methyltransferase [Saprospiraceae bacterium]|nr:RNA methyltransferase [Saprospiraceae bacterium]